MNLQRLRKLAGLSRIAITEDMATAYMKYGKWTDGTYTDGDPITMLGQGMNIEFFPVLGHQTSDTGLPVEGAWFAINNEGDEVEFTPGEEDRHDSMVEPEQMFPESDVDGGKQDLELPPPLTSAGSYASRISYDSANEEVARKSHSWVDSDVNRDQMRSAVWGIFMQYEPNELYKLHKEFKQEIADQNQYDA